MTEQWGRFVWNFDSSFMELFRKLFFEICSQSGFCHYALFTVFLSNFFLRSPISLKFAQWIFKRKNLVELTVTFLSQLLKWCASVLKICLCLCEFNFANMKCPLFLFAWRSISDVVSFRAKNNRLGSNAFQILLRPWRTIGICQVKIAVVNPAWGHPGGLRAAGKIAHFT